MPPRLTIDIQNRTRSRVPGSRLPTLLRRALACQKITRGEWRISLLGDAAMAELHGRTMGLPTTTDVLTFDLRGPRPPRGLLDLDTAICIDEARRQARARRIALADEILLYAVHSLLHVCGYDDIVAAAAARMHRREDTILNAIGVGSVYARPAVSLPAKRTTKRARR